MAQESRLRSGLKLPGMVIHRCTTGGFQQAEATTTRSTRIFRTAEPRDSHRPSRQSGQHGRLGRAEELPPTAALPGSGITIHPLRLRPTADRIREGSQPKPGDAQGSPFQDPRSLEEIDRRAADGIRSAVTCALPRKEVGRSRTNQGDGAVSSSICSDLSAKRILGNEIPRSRYGSALGAR